MADRLMKAAHVLAIFAGWGLVTAGLASLLVPEVWLISAGLLCLSFAGWNHLAVLAAAGVWAIRRKALDS